MTVSPLSRPSLSRVLSHALRHEPWLYGVELDANGWADLDQLLHALRKFRGAWGDLQSAHIEAMIEISEKRRHEICGGRIRALYGHSVLSPLEKDPQEPPFILFHGTARHTGDVILGAGLFPMGRQFVHLSLDQDTALAVGRRKDKSPVLLMVAAIEAHRHGVAFYQGNEKVWLADKVPPQFICLGPSEI